MCLKFKYEFNVQQLHFTYNGIFKTLEIIEIQRTNPRNTKRKLIFIVYRTDITLYIINATYSPYEDVLQ